MSRHDRVAGHPATRIPRRGLVLRGRVWAGGTTEPADGLVVVAGDGRVVAVGPRAAVPPGAAEFPAEPGDAGGAGQLWIGPALVDAHGRLRAVPPARRRAAALLALGIGAVRELAPRRLRPPGIVAPRAPGDAIAMAPGQLLARRTGHAPGVVTVGMDPAGGWEPPAPRLLRDLVGRAHERGVAGVAAATPATMVARAVAAGVDGLAQVPTERLPRELIERIAGSGIVVPSLLHQAARQGHGAAAAGNAAELAAAGARLVYGTGIGGAGSRIGVDPRELDRLAASGMGRLGALRAATVATAGVAGVPAGPVRIEAGSMATLVVLGGDPLVEPGLWCRPRLVVGDGWLRWDGGDPPAPRRRHRPQPQERGGPGWGGAEWLVPPVPMPDRRAPARS